MGKIKQQMELELISERPKSKSHVTPLLFIHGKWHAAWCWAENFLPYFAEHGYNSYALSLRGHGGSEGYEHLRWTSISDYVADVAQVASRMNTHPVLIGHSMGGFITQKYLEKVSAPAAVLLTSIPPSGIWPGTWLILRRQPLAILKSLFTLSLYPIVATPELARQVFFSKEMPVEKVTAYHERLQNESFRAYVDELGLNLVRPKRIRTHLLVIGADDDMTLSQKDVRATARTYGTTATFFPKMSHDVMLEERWQAVADRILEFLKERGI